MSAYRSRTRHTRTFVTPLGISAYTRTTDLDELVVYPTLVLGFALRVEPVAAGKVGTIT